MAVIMFRSRSIAGLSFMVLCLLLLYIRNHHMRSAHRIVSPVHQSVEVSIATPRTKPSDTSVSTTIPGKAHVHGVTIFDNLYLKQGVFYIVSDRDPTSFPERKELLSKGVDLDELDVEPGDEQLRVISHTEARNILGDHAVRVYGLTVIMYDSPQFVTHLYHMWGEIILAFWRVYSVLAPPVTGVSALPFPSLFIMPNIPANRWRDRAGIDGPTMRAAFPNAAIETAEYWADLKKLNTTVAFDRTVLVDRWAAHKHPFGGRWFKMVAGVMSLDAPTDFWAPLRTTLVTNLIGYLPNINGQGIVTDPPAARTTRPIVLYISRQGTGRRLLPEAHEGLVAALKELENAGVCELHIPVMEKMSLNEQIGLAAKSTIIVGVHGNGLTHQLWMPRSPRSAIFEIFFPPGFVFDYEMLARNMGHKHYAVHNDTLLTYPKGTYHDGVNVPEGLHSSFIPVHGPTVAQAIKERLTGPLDG